MNMRTLNIASRLLLGIILGSLVLHTPVAAQKVGSTSMQFLKVMPSARAVGMGEAYSTLALGAEALFWNPSGLAEVKNHEISLTYVDWVFDTRQGALSYAISLGSIGALGAQIQYVDFGVFEETTNDRPFIKNPDAVGFTGRSFRPFSYLIGVTYARSLTDRFSVGIGMKYAHESLFNGQMVRAMVTQGVYEEVKTWGNSVLFDFGIRYNTGFRSVHIASSVQNFGADVTYAKESHPAPLLFRFGIAADLVGRNALLASEEENNRVTVAFDIFHPNDYSQQGHFGIEYEFACTFAFRGGYKFNYDYEGLTFGFGVKHVLGGIGLSIDFSYGSMGTYLGSAQRISIGAVLP
jgi:hypothetical protein